MTEMADWQPEKFTKATINPPQQQTEVATEPSWHTSAMALVN